MLKNLSISTRLVGSFSVLIILLLITSLIGIKHIAAIMENLEQTAQSDLPKMMLAKDLSYHFMDSNQSVYELQVVTTEEERKRVKNDLARIDQSIQQNIESLQKIITREDVKARLNDIIKRRDALKPIYDELFNLVGNDPKKAQELAHNKVDPAVAGLAKAIRDMTDLLDSYVEKAREHAANDYTEAKTNSILIMLISLLLSSFMAIWVIRSITRPLLRIQNTVGQVEKDNDFTLSVDVNTQDEVGKTARTFNALIVTLRRSVSHIKKSVHEVADASESLAAAASQSAHASEVTSESASSMAAAVEQMTVSIAQVSDNAKSASSLAAKAGKLSDEGGQVISDTVSEMRNIGQTIDQVADAIGELGAQSDKISSIVQVIKEVADQTNLLALNAAIEAARAGEAGRGFAVVADEVRKLAERTSGATGEISTMIGAIQTSSQSAVHAMQKTVEQVKSGRELATKAGEAIVEIRQSSLEVVNVVGNIAGAITEQSAAAQAIANQLENVAQGAEENSTSARQTAKSATQLGELAKSMDNTTEQFRT